MPRLEAQIKRQEDVIRNEIIFNVMNKKPITWDPIDDPRNKPIDMMNITHVSYDTVLKKTMNVIGVRCCLKIIDMAKNKIKHSVSKNMLLLMINHQHHTCSLMKIQILERLISSKKI